MDATIASIVISVLSLVILRYTIKLANRYWFRPKKIEKRLRELGFRGNPYRIIFGDAKDLVAMRGQLTSKPMELSDDITPRILPYQRHMAQKFGKKYFIWFGTKLRLTIMDPVLVKEILSRPNEFHKPNNDQMGRVLAGGLFSSEGNTWTKHKKILNPSFHMEKIKNMVPSIVEGCLEMMEKWNMSLASKESIEIDMVPEIQTLINNIMCKTVVTGQISEETKRIYQLRITVNQQSVKLAKFMFFPGWWHLPFLEVKTLKAAHEETQSLVKKMVTRRLEEMKTGASNQGDVLSLMLEAYQDEASGVSLDDVIEECRSFHFVGPESTACSQMWMLYALAKYPEWQERAREEVLQVFGDQKPKIEGQNQLKIVTMIIYEVLRLYPPTGMFHRAISKDTKLGDMVLPAWIQVTIPITLMHHDPDIWGEDATQFNPERFAEGVFNSKMQLLTFTAGPRKCTGQSMAMVTHKSVIAALLQRFSFELSPSYIHAPKHSFLLTPQHGMKLVVRKIV
ncbi:Cytochrome P450, family 72, subfamily C, polypeptide 1 [Heracleum sosnowskyi]|uniref:Cytochrome P450, family 72, subfamily C, polypeptide 1 n=1 Tax=Heracleum sosnowskyi TaxID=360622 RepID=A0AAD8LVJ4_9APIA|nr:Cytochrome P450, family 72, subfamily C, polypeptide 1 [Heracleum sosnowskyi]